MGLGIYLEDATNYNDYAEEVKVDIAGGTAYIPDFKANNTIQIWKLNGANITIREWIGGTLVPDTVHTIKLENKAGVNVSVSFNTSVYEMIDNGENIIEIPVGKLAYFYGVAYSHDGNLVLGLRIGSEDQTI